MRLRGRPSNGTADTPAIDWTPRQREVLELLARGRTNPEIGQALGVSLDGAKWHVSEVMSKLGVRSREEAGSYWREHESTRAKLGRGASVFTGIGALRVAAAAGTLLAIGVIVLVVFAAFGSDESPLAVDPTPAGSPTASATPSVAAAAQTQTSVAAPSATPGASVTTTPVVDPAGMHPPGTRTGNSAVDRVIELVEAGDVDGLIALATWTPQPCQANPNPSGFTVMCLPGMPEGTLRDAFFLVHVEGGWQTDADWLRSFVASNVNDAAFLYGVHTRTSEATSGSGGLLTHITFARSLADSAPPEFVLDEDGQFIQAVRGQIWRSLPSRFTDAEWLFPPVSLSPPGGAQVEGFYAPAARTNYPGIDAFLDARASGDEQDVRQQIAFEPISCTNTPAIDALPCAAGEPEGTLVNAIAVNDGCHGSMIREDDAIRIAGLVRRLADPGLHLYAARQASNGDFFLFMAPDLAAGTPTIVRITGGMVSEVRTSCFASIDEAFELPVEEFGEVLLPPVS